MGHFLIKATVTFHVHKLLLLLCFGSATLRRAVQRRCLHAAAAAATEMAQAACMCY